MQVNDVYSDEDVIILVGVLAGVIVMWFIPSTVNVKFAFVILGIGLLFDLLSLFYNLMTILTGKYMSGFPVIGFLCYLLFLLTSKFSLVGWNETSLAHIMLYKVADALILLAFYIGCQIPMRFQKSREYYGQEKRP